MIDIKSLDIEWIKKVSAENRKADKILIEKVIRALLLLEGLSQSGLSFIFKGGTAVMLLLGTPKRFSIDIDIVVPIKSGLDTVLKRIAGEKGFTKYELQNRKTGSGIDKLHYKFFYTPVHQTNTSEDNILLDVLVEASGYTNIKGINIVSPFVKQKGAPYKVQVPSREDILADKMTAFAPNTIGVPYEKGGYSRSMEIIKQLYDIGSLFETIKDPAVVRETFYKIAETEMRYRNITGAISIALDDIFQTALCLSTKGASGAGDFNALQRGVSQIKAYIFSEGFHLEKAIVHAARTAYLSKVIGLMGKNLEKFSGPEQIAAWTIECPGLNKLNKLKKSNPEAFFYWYQAYLMETNGNRDGCMPCNS